MKRLAGRVAAITGAGSGIGRALAEQLAAEGMDLALSDVDADGLADTARSIRDVKVSQAIVDVAKREAVEQWALDVEREHGAAHMIINNAGVGLAASLRKVSYEDFVWLMDIDFWGVVHGTRAFLPILEKQDEGHVVNISSVFGIVAAPLNGTYNAAKFAVRGYTEALRMELMMDEIPVAVTCVHPGGIRTNIARASRVLSEDLQKPRDQMEADFDRLARTTPDGCARQIIAGIKRDAPRVLVGADAHVIDVLQRLLPTGYQAIARRLVGKFRKT